MAYSYLLELNLETILFSLQISDLFNVTAEV